MSIQLKDLVGSDIFYTAALQNRDGDLVLTQTDLEIFYGVESAKAHYVGFESAIRRGDAQAAQDVLKLMAESRSRQFVSITARGYEELRAKGLPPEKYATFDDAQKKEVVSILYKSVDDYQNFNFPHSQSYFYDSQEFSNLSLLYYMWGARMDDGSAASIINTLVVAHSVLPTPEEFVKNYETYIYDRFSPKVDAILQQRAARIASHELQPSARQSQIEAEFGINVKLDSLIEECSADVPSWQCATSSHYVVGAAAKQEEREYAQDRLSRALVTEADLQFFQNALELYRRLRPDDIGLLKGLTFIIAPDRSSHASGEYSEETKTIFLNGVLNKKLFEINRQIREQGGTPLMRNPLYAEYDATLTYEQSIFMTLFHEIAHHIWALHGGIDYYEKLPISALAVVKVNINGSSAAREQIQQPSNELFAEDYAKFLLSGGTQVTQRNDAGVEFPDYEGRLAYFKKNFPVAS